MDDDARFLVSGWEDDLHDIDEQRNPKEKLEKSIMDAAENGNLDEVKTLVEANPSLVHTKDTDGYTPLHRACYGNHVEVARFLLMNGADVAAKTEVLWEPLHSCCQWNHKECAALLIQYGANINALSEGGQTPLHIAASHGADYSTVQMLLMHPYVKSDLQNKNKDTPTNIAQRSSKYYNVFDIADPLLDVDLLNKLK